MSDAETLHATTVSIGGRGVLIAGPSGSGKSDLALRLIDRGATLIADDRTQVRRMGDTVMASAPAMIAGRLEVRGVGILSVEHEEEVTLALSVALDEPVERLPRPQMRSVAGVMLPHLPLDPRPASAPIKVELALRDPAMVVA